MSHSSLLLHQIQSTAQRQIQQLCLPFIFRRAYARNYLQPAFFFRTPNHLKQKNLRAHNLSRLYATFLITEAARRAKLQKQLVQTEELLEQQYLSSHPVGRVWHACSRLVKLSLLFTPSIVLYPLGQLNDGVNEHMWRYTVFALEKAGPTFIKLAQWASTRSDLFGEKAASVLSKLRDNTKPHKWSKTVDLLEAEFGGVWEDVLCIDDQRPIGSGCMAQVYKAKLKMGVGALPPGTELAVKVQHPGLCHKVGVDFYIMEKVASFLENIPMLGLEYLDLCSSINAFKSSMVPQLNFLAELDNLKTFRKNFDGDNNIRFPMGIESLSTKSVLTESFCRGTNILEFDGSTEEKEKLAMLSFEMVTKMIFLHDFIHGDLHPGNILVERLDAQNNKSEDSWWGKITGNTTGLVIDVIDCGLVVKMGLDEHRNLVKILGSLVKKEGYQAGKLMIIHQEEQDFIRGRRRGSLRSEIDEELFCRGIEQICIDDDDNNFLECVGDYLADICFLACKHRVKLEAKFINAAIACEIMEGIASSLYPTMKVANIALPMVVKAEVMHGLKNAL